MTPRNDVPHTLSADASHADGLSAMDRRDFLSVTSSGLLVAFSMRPGPVRPELPAAAAQQRAGTDFNAFLHIGADGRVTTYVGKIEMGQGVSTSFPQLVADELNVPISAVDIVLGDTDLCPIDMGTFGSLSIRQLGPAIRAAAAEARATLVAMAADRLQLPAASLEVKDGIVQSRTDASKRVSYGELTAGKRIERRLEGPAPLEAVSAMNIVGTSVPRRDAIEKVTGRAKYAGDIAPKGALHARIVRPPAHGAVLANIDTTAAESVPGARVVRAGELVAVLHAHRDEADKAMRLIKATYGASPSPLNDRTIFAHLEAKAPAGNITGSAGQVADALKGANVVVEQTYLKGYVAHAPMETHSAVAEFADGKLTVWASTQTPFPLKTQLARAVNLAPEKVRVITPYVGGGFGGKSAGAQAIEAARLAMVAGVPVRVIWERDEEFFYDTFDPAAVIKIKAGLDSASKIVAWDYTVIGAGDRGAAHGYEIPNHRTLVRGGWMGNSGDLHPFGIGPWRAPGANANVFARESHMDMLAAKAGVDPLEFRLKNLTDPRMRGVLQAAAAKFGYVPKVAPSGRGIGIACGTDAGTWVASIAEVKVNRETGEVTVVRVVCAQDMGLVVHPDGTRQQLEGCISMGLGYTLSEEVRFSNGVVLDKNYGTYAIPRFSWVPKIEAVIIEASDKPPMGGGEPAIITMGAVVANAVFDAVGARVVQLPITKVRLKEALARTK